MQLDFIATLASREVRLRFFALERSLRATGCELPLRVIPYNKNKFDLPANSFWWEDSQVLEWLERWKAHPMMRKYQCLLQENYHFIDTDAVFLKNPELVLQGQAGFITSCGHWKNPNDTLTAESKLEFEKRSTNWQWKVFNAGQWACDRQIFTFEQLKTLCEREEFRSTCLQFPHHDQPGLNLLVLESGIDVHNLTLPPVCMESTWAGDYSSNYESYWSNPSTSPYLIHWAGCHLYERRPIDSLFERFLTQDEMREFEQSRQQSRYTVHLGTRIKGVLRRIKKRISGDALRS